MNDPDILDIIKYAKSGLEYGTINLTLKMDNQHLTTIDTSKYTTHKTRGGNVEALTIVGTLIKNTGIAIKQDPEGVPNNLSFTLFFKKDGECDRISIQDFKRFNEMK